MIIYQTKLDTRHFEFEAYGTTAREAQEVLASALAEHTLQYNLEPGWWEDYDITALTISVGRGYRDGSIIA